MSSEKGQDLDVKELTLTNPRLKRIELDFCHEIINIKKTIKQNTPNPKP